MKRCCFVVESGGGGAAAGSSWWRVGVRLEREKVEVGAGGGYPWIQLSPSSRTKAQLIDIPLLKPQIKKNIIVCNMKLKGVLV